jgi:hypothetical protein
MLFVHMDIQKDREFNLRYLEEILGEEERLNDQCYILMIKLKKNETHKYLFENPEEKSI